MIYYYSMSLPHFSQTKLEQSVASSQLHTCRNSNQPHLLLKLPSLPSVPSLKQVSRLPLSSHPTTCPLDPIPSHLLHAISPSLLPALTHIINTSLLTGIFPTAFKQARVTPLLKKPTLNTSLIENYRTVSILPFIEKTLERVVFNQLSSFLSKNNLPDANQSGFRRGHSNETTIIHWSPANCKSWFLTLSIIRSSCPPSHHWTSLGFHFAGLNPISLAGLSGWRGEGRYPQNINWSLGFLRFSPWRYCQTGTTG